MDFDAPRLGRAALERASAATGARLTASGFHLRPLTGLVLDDVEADASFNGGRAAVSIDRLVLDHRVLRLLVGEVAVDRLSLRRPRIRLVESQAPRAATPHPVSATAAAGLGPLSLRVSRIDIDDGTIELQALGEPRPVIVNGLELRLRDVSLEPGTSPALARLNGAGELRVAEIAFAKTRALGLRGDVRVAGGRLSTDTVRFRTDEGPFEAALDVDLGRLPVRYALRVQGEPLDVAAMMGARGFGAGALRLETGGEGAEAEGLRGQGVLRLQPGTLPATPLLQALEQVLGRIHLVGAPYQATEAPFRIEHGRVFLDGFGLQAEQVRIHARGWVSLSGPLELTLAVRTPREGLDVKGVGGDMLDLLTDEEGQVVVPLKVTGTQQTPRVGPDSAALALRAGRSGARALVGKASRGLSGLFRRKPREQ